MDLSRFGDQYIHVQKLWGEEIWLTNSDKYCAKFLHLMKGFQCSLHRHLVKDEQFFVIGGGPVDLEIQTGKEQKFKQMIRLEQGDNYHIPVGVYHRFSARAGASLILEVSTRHDDMDVERLEDSKEI